MSPLSPFEIAETFPVGDDPFEEVLFDAGGGEVVRVDIAAEGGYGDFALRPAINRLDEK